MQKSAEEGRHSSISNKEINTNEHGDTIKKWPWHNYHNKNNTENRRSISSFPKYHSCPTNIWCNTKEYSNKCTTNVQHKGNCTQMVVNITHDNYCILQQWDINSLFKKREIIPINMILLKECKYDVLNCNNQIWLPIFSKLFLL